MDAKGIGNFVGFSCSRIKFFKRFNSSKHGVSFFLILRVKNKNLNPWKIVKIFYNNNNNFNAC